MKLFRFAALATALIGGLALAAPALAAPAQATASLNVRMGPGTNFGVVDVLAPGERVDVQSQTSNGWCAIRQNGPNGFVSCRYLAFYPVAPATPPRPDVTITFNFGSGPNFPNRRDRVCFFEDIGYLGESFCASPGQSVRRLTGFWDDRISSIRIYGDAWVTVCEDRNFHDCQDIHASRISLGRLNRDITSFVVHRAD